MRRDGAIEDHQGGVLAVRDLHRAQPIAGRGEPGRLDVEGEETVAREGVVEAVKRDGEEPLEGRADPSEHFPSSITGKFFSSPPPNEKISPITLVMHIVLGAALS